MVQREKRTEDSIKIDESIAKLIKENEEAIQDPVRARINQYLMDLVLNFSSGSKSKTLSKLSLRGESLTEDQKLVKESNISQIGKKVN